MMGDLDWAGLDWTGLYWTGNEVKEAQERSSTNDHSLTHSLTHSSAALLSGRAKQTNGRVIDSNQQG
jgi:hypothetical protein